MVAEDSLQIHHARWVIPVARPVIAEGGVAVRDGLIVAVDTFSHLRQQHPHARVINHGDAALTPALVNGHIHLELSHLKDLSAVPCKGSFTDWISRLLELRHALGATGEKVEQAALLTLAQQYESGVSVLVDIGNTMLGHRLRNRFDGLLVPFKEYLGLAESRLQHNLQKLQEEPDDVRCTGHAPYSTHARLLQELKRRSRELGHIFSLHTAEPPAESELIREGRGEMVDFFRQRGFWDGSFQPRKSGSGGSIQYLRDLGILDERTLCVHSIHVSEEEIRILAGEGGKVCLCPGSNRFLGVGKAPVQQLIENGLLPALGTDSLASNPELSLWREMRIILEDSPEIEPAVIFAMATRGGAEALGLGNRLGTLEPGKTAEMLVVPVPEDQSTPALVSRYLVTRGTALQPDRAPL